MSMKPPLLKKIIEGALLASEKPLSIARLLSLFAEDEGVSEEMIRDALSLIEQDDHSRGVELKEVSSGFRMQVKSECAAWVSRLWDERPQRYSRALLETLVLMAYRQPVTRAEIEDVRGVAVSSNIIKTLQEREWIRVLGHREVPGRPALYGTTRQFLDYFNLKSLEELPSLKEITDLDNIILDLEGNTTEEAVARRIMPAQDAHIEAVDAEDEETSVTAEVSVVDTEDEETPVTAEVSDVDVEDEETSVTAEVSVVDAEDEETLVTAKISVVDTKDEEISVTAKVSVVDAENEETSVTAEVSVVDTEDEKIPATEASNELSLDDMASVNTIKETAANG